MMMDHQYGENGVRNIYSNYDQMRAYVKCSPNQSKKLCLINLSIEQSMKLCLNLPEYNFAVQLYKSTLIR